MNTAALDLRDIYRRHHPRVMRLLIDGFTCASRSKRRAVVRLLNAADAEEVCHDTFRAFFERCAAGEFDASRDVASYLRGIAKNLAMQRIERVAREVPTTDIDALMPPDEALEARHEATRTLAAVFAGLDEQERAVLAHYYDDDQSQEAVGRRLGLSRDQVFRIAAGIRRKALQVQMSVRSDRSPRRYFCARKLSLRANG